MRALLSEGGDSDGALPLDQFHPEAFRAVLDYMYGSELRLSVDVSILLFGLVSFYVLAIYVFNFTHIPYHVVCRTLSQ